MVTAAPFIIVLGAVGAVGLFFYGFWDRISGVLVKLTSVFRADIERADLKVSSEQLAFGVGGLSVFGWLFFVVIAHPSLLIASISLPAALLVVAKLCQTWLKGKVKARIKAFHNQLELVLRMIGNGLRVGLGLRQALVLVTEELPDPARVEFAQLIGQTNIGVPLNDALDSLVDRMYSEELRMMVDAIKVQSETGGNLAKILDHLATTIKARRNIQRKIRSITSEARSGAYVIGALPLGVGLFIIVFQPDMRVALFTTPIGHLGLIAFVILEGLGILSLRMLLAFEI